MTVKDFYPRNVFITLPDLNTLTNTTMVPMQYNNLKAHIKSKIGHNKQYDVISTMNMQQIKKQNNNIISLMTSIKKGSGKYRSILQKKVIAKDIHSTANWRSKINDNTITSLHIKQKRRNLQSRYIGSDTADTL